MNAALKPLLTSRTEYIGFRLVSGDNYEEWVALNVDAIANNFFLGGGTDLDKLAAFCASEWEKERDRRDDYANFLKVY
jgi:hypothetical protein